MNSIVILVYSNMWIPLEFLVEARVVQKLNSETTGAFLLESSAESFDSAFFCPKVRSGTTHFSKLSERR